MKISKEKCNGVIRHRRTENTYTMMFKRRKKRGKQDGKIQMIDNKTVPAQKTQERATRVNSGAPNG